MKEFTDEKIFENTNLTDLINKRLRLFDSIFKSKRFAVTQNDRIIGKAGELLCIQESPEGGFDIKVYWDCKDTVRIMQITGFERDGKYHVWESDKHISNAEFDLIARERGANTTTLAS